MDYKKIHEHFEKMAEDIYDRVTGGHEVIPDSLLEGNPRYKYKEYIRRIDTKDRYVAAMRNIFLDRYRNTGARNMGELSGEKLRDAISWIISGQGTILSIRRELIPKLIDEAYKVCCKILYVPNYEYTVCINLLAQTAFFCITQRIVCGFADITIFILGTYGFL